jgi:hypothetical protein
LTGCPDREGKKGTLICYGFSFLFVVVFNKKWGVGCLGLPGQFQGYPGTHFKRLLALKTNRAGKREEKPRYFALQYRKQDHSL